MEAGKIKCIVNELDKLPYKCIMFDGDWGIGKTYAIDEVLDERKNCCKISMFGLNSSQQIFHEIICRLTRWKYLPAVSRQVNKISNCVAQVSDKVNIAKEIVCNFIDEKELFVTFSKGFRTWHYIVIDDLERMSCNINLEEILGVIDELKKCSYVKIVILVNKKEMKTKAKEILEKYEEKIVDRIYYITDMPSNINWGELGIDAFFMQDFLKKHNVKNLRTLQKAQNFYDDVELHIESIKNDEFKKEIRLICFAIVTESIENLYCANKKRELPEKIISEQINDNIDRRILYYYLLGIKSNVGLLHILLKYYNNEIELDDALVADEYQVFLNVGNKPVSYLTETEAIELLNQLEGKFEFIATVGELNSTADVLIEYSKILYRDYSLLLNKYEEKLYSIMTELVLSGHESVLSYGASILDVSSKEIIKIYDKVCNAVGEELIISYINILCDLKTADKKTFEYSYKLRKCYEHNNGKKVLHKYLGKLYNIKFFPITDMSEDKYHTCYNIMSILYHEDSDKFFKYCDEIACDKMARHRMKKLVEELVRSW